MAVDTKQKRFSMMSMGEGSECTLFEADGTVDLDDKQHLLGCYSGIAFGAPAGGASSPYFYFVHLLASNHGT